MANKFHFDRVQQNMSRLKTDLPIVLANDAQRFFVNSFRQQGWEDGGMHLWPLRSNEAHKIGTGQSDGTNLGRNLLVKSGALRRAVNNSIRGVTFDKIRLVVDLPYAAIHNEGGKIQVGARTQVLHFSKKGKLSKPKKANRAMKANIGAHVINIPQRKYMGDSKELRVIQRAKIIKAIDHIWRG